MIDEEGNETEESGGPAPDERALAPLAALFNGVLQKREGALLKGIEAQIALLAETPDRSNVGRVVEDGDGTREERTIVSRNQPTDPLYRGLHRQHPEQREARSPNLDHWNAVWLRAFMRHDHVEMRLAEAKSN